MEASAANHVVLGPSPGSPTSTPTVGSKSTSRSLLATFQAVALATRRRDDAISRAHRAQVRLNQLLESDSTVGEVSLQGMEGNRTSSMPSTSENSSSAVVDAKKEASEPAPEELDDDVVTRAQNENKASMPSTAPAREVAEVEQDTRRGTRTAAPTPPNATTYRVLQHQYEAVSKSAQRVREKIADRLRALVRRTDGLAAAEKRLHEARTRLKQTQLDNARADVANLRAKLARDIADVYAPGVNVNVDKVNGNGSVAVPSIVKLPLTLEDVALRQSPLQADLSDFGASSRGDADRVAAAMGYVAEAVLLLARYLDVPLRYPLEFRGSKSRIHDGAHLSTQLAAAANKGTKHSSSADDIVGITLVSPPGSAAGGGAVQRSPSAVSPIGGGRAAGGGVVPAPRVFPLHCGGGVERAAFAYGAFLLNRDITHLLQRLHREPLGPRHTIANLNLLVKACQAQANGGAVS